MFASKTRQPLLPAHRGRALKPLQQPSQQQKTLSSFRLILVTLLLVAGGLIALEYFLLPRTLQDDQPAQTLDSDHEIFALHHDPSPHFCELNRQPRVCAHGGDIEAAPPNTLESFAAALNSGADCIEVDVSMTKDGHLISMHDRELSHLLDFNGLYTPPTTSRRSLFRWWQRHAHHRHPLGPKTADYTWSQLHQLEWSNGGPRIATLESVLNLALSVPQEVSITVDVKLRGGSWDESSEAAAMAQAVFDVLQNTGCGDYCMVWAKEDSVAVALKALSKAQRVGLVVMNETATARAAGKDEPLRLKHLGAEVAGVHYSMASAEMARLLRSAQRELHVWTANTASMMKQALDAGPDAVVTSYPKKLITALKARAAACQRKRRKEK